MMWYSGLHSLGKREVFINRWQQGEADNKAIQAKRTDIIDKGKTDITTLRRQ